jgi:hypothetical protein
MILNAMADELVEMARGAAEGLDRLALLPVELAGGGSRQEGDALAQILAINLLHIGKYAVYPRTGNLEQVQDEYKTQQESGLTRAEEAVRAGRAVNPSYVLSVISRTRGTGNRFNASITDLELGESIKGDSEQYTRLSDGIIVMEFLATKLSGGTVSERDREGRMRMVEAETSDEDRTERARALSNVTDKFLKSSGIAVGGWLGFGLGGTSIKRVKSNDGTGNLTINGVKYEQEIGFNGSISVELRVYRYFGIQTGIIGVTDYAPYTPSGGTEQYAKLSIIQIPILARFNLAIGNINTIHFLFVPFGGLGINAAVNTSDADTTDLSKPSFILGLDMGFSGQSFWLFMGYRFNGGSRGSFTVNRTSYDYTRNSHVMYFGARYYFPFRK